MNTTIEQSTPLLLSDKAYDEAYDKVLRENLSPVGKSSSSTLSRALSKSPRAGSEPPSSSPKNMSLKVESTKLTTKFENELDLIHASAAAKAPQPGTVLLSAIGSQNIP